MIRIVLDTNVLVSAIFFSGKPAVILKAWRNRNITLVVTEAILIEYEEVLHRINRKYGGKIEVESWIDLISCYTEVIAFPKSGLKISRDSADDKFIECAHFSACKLIVSGDDDLLSITGVMGIEVLNPSDFVRKYLSLF